MSVLDRVRKATDIPSLPEDTQSTSLALADPPVIQRVRFLVKQAMANSNGRVPWMVESLVDEFLNEIADQNPEELTGYIMMSAGIMKWAATGNMDELPGFLVPLAENAQKELPAGAHV